MKPQYIQYQGLIHPLHLLARKAGKAILHVYRSDDFQVQLKTDNSPLTQADKDSHRILDHGLKTLTPDWPVLSEESDEIPFAARKDLEYFWLIDPLDGTKEFINKTDEFTINIALIHQHQAVIGMIYVPVRDTLYYAAEHMDAFKQVHDEAPCKIETRPRPAIPCIVASRRHNSGKLQAFLQNYPQHELMTAGSALKICLVAEGQADIYPRLGPTYEWDTAAGQCIVEQAGGRLVDFAGKPLTYNMRESLLNPEFIVHGKEINH